MRKYILIFSATLTTIACNKTEDSNFNNNEPVEAFEELNVNKEFNWSSSKKGNLNVTMQADTNVFTFDGEEIQLVDERSEVVARQRIENNSATFTYTVPANNTSLYVYYPNTGQKVEIDGNSDIVITAQNLFTAEYDELLQNASTGIGKKTTHGTMIDLVVNGGFDNESNFETYPRNSLATGKWYVKDEGNDKDYEVKNVSGSSRFVSESNKDGYAYQLIDVTGGDLFTTTANTSGDFCTFLFFYDNNGQYLGYTGYSPNSQGDISGSGTVPTNAVYALLKVHGDNNEWIDNITFDVTSPIQDADGDNVADSDDAYPNDASRAYDNPFPTTGYQTLAFEDLWPYKGDYDFNDMVVSNQANFVKNAALDLVEVTFTMSLEAVGAGLDNGVGVVFLDANNLPIAQNMIASVSGDATLDPNVTNGIIVFSDVFAAQSTYYQNNNEGPSQAPDVFTYTVTFNSNAGNQTLIPDTYLYRTAQRGLEIHLPGFSGTAAADANLYGTGDDVNGTYRTSNGLPWGLELVTTDGKWRNPSERVDITQAYPSFQTWAESNGDQSEDWLDNWVSTLIFDLL